MTLDVNSMHTKFEFNTNFETSSNENFDDYSIFINKKNVTIESTSNIYLNFFL